MRVVITGFGAVTPLGLTASAFREALFAGTTGISPMAADDPASRGLAFRETGRVCGFDPEAYLTPQQIALSERGSQMGLVAATEALHHSGLLGTLPGDEIAAIIGCSTGGRSVEEPETARLYTKGTRVHPFTVPRVMASSGTSLISMQHGITGPAYAVSTACASATHAIGQAFHLIRSGAVTAAVCGGHEAPLTWGFLRAWDSLRVVSPTRCRPFSADRDGMTIAEGATMLVLETEENAAKRGATIYAELAGFGMSADAHHITQASTEGPARAMRMALRDAAASPDDVGYINAHGTGTLVNDRVEASALHAVFGPRAGTIPVSSTKAQHGHAMGASGAMEALATVFALHDQRLPTTTGVTGKGPGAVDPTLHLNVLTGRAQPASVTLALSNSFAFGGLNAVLALRHP